MIHLALVLAVVALLAALTYWELVLAEGVHLGPRVVASLYDLVARRYDGIKQFDPAYEECFIGEPLALALSLLHSPLVLDVATGTGRLPRTLLAQPNFAGHIIGLDSSRAMLVQATLNTSDRLTLIWQNATRLPFDDNTFDAVTCLEALEFMPDTFKALGEIVRVLRPGGVLLVTNRVGTGPGSSRATHKARQPLKHCWPRWDWNKSKHRPGKSSIIWCGRSSRGAPSGLKTDPQQRFCAVLTVAAPDAP